MKKLTFLFFLLIILSKNSTLTAQITPLPKGFTTLKDTTPTQLQAPVLLTVPKNKNLLYIPNSVNTPTNRNLLYDLQKDGVAKVIKIEQSYEDILSHIPTLKLVHSSISAAK